MGRSSAVATMLEEASCIALRHRVESPAHRFYERLAATRPDPPQQRLELVEGFFYGVEVRRVGSVWSRDVFLERVAYLPGGPQRSV